MRASLRISPEAYARVATAALLALTLIVLTGAAVRLTGSGLGCPDWPKCFGKEIAPLETHAIIEYGNRLFSGLVGFAAVAASGLAFLRRPFRRDLALLGLVLGLATVGVWWLLRRRGADPAIQRSLLTVLALLAAQGVVGTTQYLLHLPAELVWVHVGIASFTWLALLWAVAQAGQAAPRAAAVEAPQARRVRIPRGAAPSVESRLR